MMPSLFLSVGPVLADGYTWLAAKRAGSRVQTRGEVTMRWLTPGPAIVGNGT